MSIGERIKARRKEIGLSAEQVADKLGVSPATIYRYESNDIINMRIDKLEPIADVLHTTPAHLMGWEEPTQKEKPLAEDEELNRFLKLTERLSDENYQKLLDYMELLLNSQK